MKKYDRKIGSSAFCLSNRIDFGKGQENSAFEEKIVDFSKYPKENWKLLQFNFEISIEKLPMKNARYWIRPYFMPVHIFTFLSAITMGNSKSTKDKKNFK